MLCTFFKLENSKSNAMFDATMFRNELNQKFESFQIVIELDWILFLYSTPLKCWIDVKNKLTKHTKIASFIQKNVTNNQMEWPRIKNYDGRR